MQKLEDVNRHEINKLLNSFILDKAIIFFIILSTITVFLFSKILNQKRCSIRQFKMKLKKNLTALKFNFKKTASATGILILFFNIHLWLIRLMIGNNLKTDQIIVDTSQLLKTEGDLLKSSKIACFLEGDSEQSIIDSSNKENLFRKLYDLKSNLDSSIKDLKNKVYKNKCIIEPNLANQWLFYDTNVYIITNEATSNFCG